MDKRLTFRWHLTSSSNSFVLPLNSIKNIQIWDVFLLMVSLSIRTFSQKKRKSLHRSSLFCFKNQRTLAELSVDNDIFCIRIRTGLSWKFKGFKRFEGWNLIWLITSQRWYFFVDSYEFNGNGKIEERQAIYQTIKCPRIRWDLININALRYADDDRTRVIIIYFLIRHIFIGLETKTKLIAS